MAFKLRSGNETNFKKMGSSPAKQRETTDDMKKDLSKVEYTQDEYEALQKATDLYDAERNRKELEEESKAKMKRVDELMKSPNKQSLDFWNQTPQEYAEYQKRQKIDHVKRTTDKIHSTEKRIGELKESRNKDIKRNKGKNVKISKKDIVRQMNKSGTKGSYFDVKKALKKSVRNAGKIAKFIPGVVGLVLSATKTATADQPTYKSTGDSRYKKGESQQIKDLLTKHKLKGGKN